MQPQNLCDIEQVTRIDVTKEDELSQKLDIQLKDPDKEVSILKYMYLHLTKKCIYRESCRSSATYDLWLKAES